MVAREPCQMKQTCGPSYQNLDTIDSPIDLPGFLNGPLRTLEVRSGKVGVVTDVTQINDIADDPVKATIRDLSGNPYAFVLCSQPQYPSLVGRGVARAEAISNLLGRELGAALIKPLLAGTVDGVSYAILPWLRPLPKSRLGRYVSRSRLRGRVLLWLRKATAVAVARHDKIDASPAFAQAIQHLCRFPRLRGDLHEAIERSLARLDTAEWRPKHTFDHNDLWLDNLLLPQAQYSPQYHGFVIIDWLGATERGFGLYDLIRFCTSAAVPTRILAREVRSHCDALQCELVDAKGHLLACLGNLYLNLECFPEDRYDRILGICWRTLLSALSVCHEER